MPTNMYGPNYNYDLNNSHFFPALIKKIYTAKIKKKNYVQIWGNGKAKRELMYVDDIADACIFFMNKKTKHSLINIGSGKDKSIQSYVKLFLKILLPNKRIKIIYDKTKPNGTPRKVMDISLAKKYGWKPNNNFNKSFDITFRDFLKQTKKSYIF